MARADPVWQDHRAARRKQIAEEKAAAETKKREAEERVRQHENLFKTKGPLDLVIVSGLPRSGTSLMMQMLQAGGLPVVSDGERAADTDNPRGYLEWEAIKTLPHNPAILYEADGRVIKVISLLLEHLPQGHRYCIVFMDRPIEEVAASHDKMIQNRREKAPDLDPARMRSNLARHRSAVLNRMQAAPGVELLVVDYPSLVRDPVSWMDRLVSFLGSAGIRDPEAMKNAIDPTLHRNRK